MSEKIKVVTLCSGYDSQCMALDVIKQKHPDFDYDLVAWSEIDKYACQMHDLIYPQYASRNLGDMTKIDWWPIKEKYGEIDLLTYSTPCFVAGTLVLTEKGYKTIENVREGDKVLTHTNTYQSVVKVGGKRAQDIVRITGTCIDEILCTPNHPFYVREMYRSGHKSVRAFREPKWKPAAELVKTDYLGMAVNALSIIPKWEGTILHYGGHDSFISNRISPMLATADFWYLMGRYMGDGWASVKRNDVMFCCSDRNENELKNALSKLGYKPTISDKEKSSRKYCVNSKELTEFVDRYGHGAAYKCVDAETLALPSELLAAFLHGYTDSDGCIVPENKEYKITTVSRNLAYSIIQVVAKVYKRPARAYKCERPSKCVIEGRECNQRATYQVAWHTDTRKQDKAFYEGGYVWFPCKGVETTDRKEDVYNMEVDADNSYTANGVIVHNCQDISQAGKQMGLKEGSETRSALLWKVVDAIEVLKPKYLLQENVAALVSKKFMPDFQKWLQRLEQLGYVNRWARLNAKDYGVPQNRNRVFCLSMRRDVAFDYQFPAPVPLDRKLADVLEEEVADRYFLKDDAVAKFLKANEKDDVVFMQFPYEISHETAMFLKTWLSRLILTRDLWTAEDHTQLVRDIEALRPELDRDVERFHREGIDAFGQEFAEEYRENMERKPK